MQHFNIEELNNFCKGTLIEHLGIQFIEFNQESIKARMPVDNRTIQPMKLLHGGAVMALAETVASAGSFLLVDNKIYDVLGLELNGNHIGNTTSSFVIATANIIHKGKQTHVWNVSVNDEFDKPISVCRVTNIILKKEKQ
jgi:1,4-dihydroxy-2-naphthoyl-CoA hydrolase